MSAEQEKYSFGFYEVMEWGDQVDGETKAAPVHCTMRGIAKRDSKTAPYAVANEFICGRLGLLVGLPVPPGVIIRDQEGHPAYVSIQFGKKELPPPIVPAQFVEDHPKVASGVVAFDYWIGNVDRHKRNLAYSRLDNSLPPMVFDHSHALLGPAERKGEQYLADLLNEHYLERSCLTKLIKDESHFKEWSERIEAVPDSIVVEICEYTESMGAASPKECDAAVDFLLQRKNSVYETIRNAKEVFQNVEQWGLSAS